MRSVIHQNVTLPAPAEQLFDMYMDATLHSAITGAPVLIGDTPNSEFHAFDGVLSGAILCVHRPNLIVQSWRSTQFTPEDIDSTLILSFVPRGDEGEIVLVHVDVPNHDYDGVIAGWQKYYWSPWRRYLENRG